MIRFIEKLIKWIEETLHFPEIPLSTKGFSLGKKIQFFLLKSYFNFKRHQGLIIRALISWCIGLIILHLDEVNNYDFRLSIRGEQTSNPQIVVLEFTQLDLNTLFPHRNELKELKDDSTLSLDTRYWNPQLWSLIITKLLSLEPKVIGVSLLFDEKMNLNLPKEERERFSDPRIMWMGALSQSGRIQLPPFANKKNKNYGFGDFLRDEDGVLRSLPAQNPHYPSLPYKLAENYFPSNKFQAPNSKNILNYRGGNDSFLHVSVRDLLRNKILPDQIKNKIVIVGANAFSQNLYVTPIGNLSNADLIAHITDNLVANRWIKRIPNSLAIIELFFVMLISVFLMNYFPQKVAFVFLSFLSLSIIALSIWFFDTFFFWTPALSPLVQIMSTWSVFVGYIASKIEQKNWQLEQEKKSLAQLEQLKNNFVSLISHDLKTPIAKIQAITDRLLLGEPSPEITQDLKSLRASSSELNRYIQSVLKILRVESKEFQLNKEVVDINEIIQMTLVLVRPLAEDKKITIQEILEPLFSIEVDPTLIQEVFINILENAIKYTPKNGSVMVESQEIDDYILIRITDTGEGIHSDDLESVFGKFVRGKNQELKTKGTGLGLYLVKYFVELHGGRVSLTSEVGKGTTVDLYLPTES